MTNTDESAVTISDSCYGKKGVKLLYVKKDSPRHEIAEFEVVTLLKLRSDKDYLTGDNGDVVPTDTQKNTVFVVAQKYGVGCEEVFAQRLCKHFLFMYPQVISADVQVESSRGWERMVVDGRQHNHSFISKPSCTRWAQVYQRRDGPHSLSPPQITAGLTGLRILKTTQSSFLGFNECAYTTLKPATDRIVSTIVDCSWKYNPRTYQLDYCTAWNKVLGCIIDEFAGPASGGKLSPSVQTTMYEIEKTCLRAIPQMSEISMALPNVHYFDVDMERFKDHALKNTQNVFMPNIDPSGLIKCTLTRSKSKL